MIPDMAQLSADSGGEREERRGGMQGVAIEQDRVSSSSQNNCGQCPAKALTSPPH